MSKGGAGKKPQGPQDALSQTVFSTDQGDLRKAGLGGALGNLLGRGEKPAAPVNAHTAKPAPAPKLTVRLERKGRGGKTVTLVENYRGPGPSAAQLAKDLKAQCGTGGSLEDDGAILVQGDQRERVAAHLRKLGLNPSVSGG